MHHGRPWGTSKTFLLAYIPLCGLSSESHHPHAVCRHSSPRAADESSDYLNRTHVEIIFGGKGHQPEKSGRSGSWEDGTWKGNVSSFNLNIIIFLSEASQSGLELSNCRFGHHSSSSKSGCLLKTCGTSEELETGGTESVLSAWEGANSDWFFFDISLAPSVGMKLWRLKVKILIVRELLDDIVWNMVNTLPSIKGSDSAFFHNFLDFFFEGPPCFQGQFHRHFLKNVSWDYKDENWPRASLNLFGIIFACFPIIFFGGLWLSTTVVTTEFGTARFVALIPQLSPLQAFRKYVNLSVIFIVSYLTFPRVHLSRLGNPLFVISHSGIEEYTCRV